MGTHFLTQLGQLSATFNYLRLILIARSNQCLYVPSYDSALPLATWQHDLSTSTQSSLCISELLQYLKLAPGKCILIDNTSSQDIAGAYPEFLRHGISIVTPNKKAFSGSTKLWSDIFAVACGPYYPSGGLLYHESSVGAGLPVISTLKDLIETGDTIHKIEGVFSGTMSFLFNSFAPVNGTGGKWSEEVRKAKELGYTEPDPRDDLNGLDVARKLVILARLAGFDVHSTSSFPVQSLIPQELEHVSSGDEFLARLPEFDGQMEHYKETAEKEGKVLRFVASIDTQTKDVKVGLEMFEKQHPIAALKRSDNIISFYTKRYGNNPLIIQGAG